MKEAANWGGLDMVGFEKCLPLVPIHLFPVARARAWHSSKLCPFLACWDVAFSAMTGPEQTASANAITATRNICLLRSVAEDQPDHFDKILVGHSKFQVRQQYVYARALQFNEANMLRLCFLTSENPRITDLIARGSQVGEERCITAPY
jgi:hypothetical protein